ncbi:Protein scalloped [Lucilia cuprina]|nr:Protein scalloped [Lucilia cuprina]
MAYESNENVVLVCSTKVCSFGSQVVEKVETEYSRLENGRFVYRIERSPMCEYMINFIQKLKNLPEHYMMNSVLENFTILQVIQSRETQETLLCIAYVFEVAAQNTSSMLIEERGDVIMDKKESSETVVNSTRYLAGNNTTTTIIKQSPTSPIPMDVQQQQTTSHSSLQPREDLYSTTDNLNDTTTNLHENLDLTTTSQSSHHQLHHPTLLQSHHHQQQLQQQSSHLQQHHHQQHTNLRLNANSNNNNTVTNPSNLLINCTQNIAYPRQKQELPLPLTTSMTECQLTPSEVAAAAPVVHEQRPPPPSYHTTTATSSNSQTSQTKLYHHASTAPSANSTCTNEMDSMVSSTAPDPLTASAAAASSRLTAYEQFLNVNYIYIKYIFV